MYNVYWPRPHLLLFQSSALCSFFRRVNVDFDSWDLTLLLTPVTSDTVNTLSTAGGLLFAPPHWHSDAFSVFYTATYQNVIFLITALELLSILRFEWVGVESENTEARNVTYIKNGVKYAQILYHKNNCDILEKISCSGCPCSWSFWMMRSLDGGILLFIFANPVYMSES